MHNAMATSLTCYGETQPPGKWIVNCCVLNDQEATMQRKVVIMIRRVQGSRKLLDEDLEKSSTAIWIFGSYMHWAVAVDIDTSQRLPIVSHQLCNNSRINRSVSAGKMKWSIVVRVHCADTARVHIVHDFQHRKHIIPSIVHSSQACESAIDLPRPPQQVLPASEQ